MQLRLFVACGLFSLGLATAQDTNKPPLDNRQTIPHEVVRITGKEIKNPAEVSVAINPTNPQQIRAVSFAVGGSVLCSSDDGGATWHNTRFPEPGNTRQQGDDLLVYGADGTLYHACIRFVGIRQKKPRRADNGIYTHVFKENKWSAAVPVIDHVNTVQPFEDKPWLAVDANPHSKHHGNIYVSWTRFDEYGSKEPEKKSYVQFARSTNGGKSYFPVERISETPGDCLDSSNTVMGAMPAVGPEGQIYVVWSGPDGIVLDRSNDGGVTFGKDTLVSKNPGGWDQPVAGTMRANGLPVIGVDTSSGKSRGTIYVTWGDVRQGDMDIFCASSSDEGKSWSTPVRVNNDPDKNGKIQFFPWMAIDQADGSINIVFYDRRKDEGAFTTMTLARSLDGGKTFVNFAIKQPSFECSDRVFFGDYIGIAAHQGKLVATYSHFTGKTELALSAALFRFKPGTMENAE